jgi:hypothetical protein
VLAIIAVFARIFVRIVVQKHFATDDAILIVGFCLLIAACVIVYMEVVNRMYIMIALEHRLPGVVPPGDFEATMQLAYDFYKWTTITSTLIWCSIMAAKFSILAFFWKLIDRIWWMRVYWWVIFALNVGILGYGVSVCYLVCPYSNDPRVCKFKQIWWSTTAHCL